MISTAASCGPWAVPEILEPEAARAVARLWSMNGGERLAGVWLDDARPADLYLKIGAVAVVSIRGVLLDRLPFHGCEWATGYNAIRLAVASALADPEITVIALDIDSGGGMVAGCFELCAWLRAASAVKPVAALVTNWSASAAYAIAASCQTISAPITGGVGSIGVVRMHLDMSKWLDEEGLRVSLVHAGKHKVDGHPFAPLPDDVRGEWQEGLEAFRLMFAEHVSAGRGMAVENVLATEARFYDDPVRLREALDLGLIDAIASPDDALAALVDHAATLN